MKQATYKQAKYLLIAGLMLALLPSVTMAQHDRGDRYRGGGDGGHGGHGNYGHSSRNYFDFSFGFGSRNFRSDFGFGRSYGARTYYAPVRSYYYEAPPAYYAPPVYYAPPAVIYSAPAYYPPPAVVYPAPVPSYYYYDNGAPSRTYYQSSGRYYYR